jgi:Flp pilus assembly protein TadD
MPDAVREARTEVGYPKGALALAAIRDGDWKQAETQLTVDADDPAQLLNLAHVYRRTGREAEAQFLYSRILELPDARDLAVGGQPASSHALARQALSTARYASR